MLRVESIFLSKISGPDWCQSCPIPSRLPRRDSSTAPSENLSQMSSRHIFGPMCAMIDTLHYFFTTKLNASTWTPSPLAWISTHLFIWQSCTLSCLIVQNMHLMHQIVDCRVSAPIKGPLDRCVCFYCGNALSALAAGGLSIGKYFSFLISGSLLLVQIYLHFSLRFLFIF